MDDVEAIANLLKRELDIPISIDTVLAKRLQPYLQAMDVPDILYETEETYGWYIDAVNEQHGPASYLPTIGRLDVSWEKGTAETIRRAFQETRGH